MSAARKQITLITATTDVPPQNTHINFKWGPRVSREVSKDADHEACADIPWIPAWNASNAQLKPSQNMAEAALLRQIKPTTTLRQEAEEGKS
jgi:hypothetical protein